MLRFRVVPLLVVFTVLIGHPAWAQDVPPAGTGAPGSGGAAGGPPPGDAGAPAGRGAPDPTLPPAGDGALNGPGAAVPGNAGGDSGGRGVMVRLESARAAIDGAVKVRLTPEGGGDTIELVLRDDGEAPDVTAADNVYAAASLVSADAFDVVVMVGSEQIPAGEVSWASDQQAARDLVIRLNDDSVSLSASVPLSAGVPTAAGPTTSGGAGAGSGKGERKGRGRSASRAEVEPSISRKDALLWMAIGLGLVGLAAAGALLSRWLANRSRLQLPALAEPPLLGPHSPSLSQGLSVWTTGDRDGVLGPLLATMARDHRVLVVMPGEGTLPSVFGGPVHRWSTLNVDQIEDALFELSELGGLPLALLLVLDTVDGKALDELAELLGDGTGGIALVSAKPTTALPTVTLETDGEDVVLIGASGQSQLRVGGRGFEVVETA